METLAVSKLYVQGPPWTTRHITEKLRKLINTKSHYAQTESGAKKKGSDEKVLNYGDSDQRFNKSL